MRRALAGLGFGIGFTAAWFIAAVIEVPLVWYLPLERRFAFTKTVTALGMDYYGRLLLALAVGALAALAAGLLARRATDRWLLHGAVWLGSLSLLTFVLELVLLVHRNPVPLEGP